MVEFVSCIKSEMCCIYRDFFDTSNKITDVDTICTTRNIIHLTNYHSLENHIEYKCVVFHYGPNRGGMTTRAQPHNDIENFTNCIKAYMYSSQFHFQLVKYDNNDKPIDIHKTDPIIPYFKEYYSRSIANW